MRVTGGILRGRRIHVPGKGVRPTQDKVREAMFSILGDRLQGARFLDLFAGSGAVGIGAWSRGAAFVCWVEADRRVYGGLRRNVEELCDRNTLVLRADVGTCLRADFPGPPFDVAFADPPYARGRTGKTEGNHSRESVVGGVLVALGRESILKPGGLLIVEYGAGQDISALSGWDVVDHRSYGRTGLKFFRKEGANSHEDNGDIRGNV
jgi:16S rRNA (guanine966-N2)-methyltransferase